VNGAGARGPLDKSDGSDQHGSRPLTYRWDETWVAACVGVGMTLALIGGAKADEPADAAGLPVEQIEKIVHDYLMRQPEVVYQALEELQKRQAAAETERQQAAIAANRDELINDSADPIAGNPEGDVTVVEFFDYQCTYCRHVVNSVRELLGEDKQLKVVFKEFPILGEASLVAARAALAASQQGQELYLPFHLALMGSRDLSLDGIMQIADQVGLDTERLARDMQAPAIDQQLQANHALAQRLGIEGTPAFVIGGDLIPGALDKSRLVSLVEEARTSCVSC
jgi:protein-disulfide isomerase